MAILKIDPQSATHKFCIEEFCEEDGNQFQKYSSIKAQAYEERVSKIHSVHFRLSQTKRKQKSKSYFKVEPIAIRSKKDESTNDEMHFIP